MSNATATLGRLTLKNASSISWALTPGVAPYATNVVVDAAEAGDVSSMVGAPFTLSVKGKSGEWEVQRVYVVDYSLGPTPHDMTLTLADKRYLWPRVHVLRRYNCRRKTGSTRLLTEGLPVNLPQVVSDYYYELATLKDGKSTWEANDSLQDILGVVDGEKAAGSFPRQISIQNCEIDDQGDQAVSRILSFCPGYNLFVDLSGRTQLLDETDFQAAQQLLSRMGDPVVGKGLANPTLYGGIRPSRVNVLFTVGQELKFTSVTEGGTYSTRRDLTKFMENVIQVTDLSLSVGGRTVSRGMYITIDEALAAWGSISIPTGKNGTKATFGQLSHSLIQKLWFEGQLESMLASLGNAVPDANWSARVAEIRKSYRQTYRISQYWMARIRALDPVRAAIIDPENGTRAPAYVTANYSYLPSTRGRLWAANLQGYVINVTDAYSDDLATSKQSPASVEIVDGELGIFHLTFRKDYNNTQQEMYPCACESPLPAANFKKGAKVPLTADGVRTQGAASFALASSHRVAIVLTAYPSAPNSNDQLFRVKVEPKEVSGFGVPIGNCTGPEWDVRIGPGMTTARFAWTDAQEAQIDKAFGVPQFPTPGQKPSYANGDALAGLLVDKDEVKAVAKAVAAALYSGMLDRITGQQAGLADGSIVPTGNAISVMHSLDADGAINSLVRFDRTSGRLNVEAFLPNSVRRRLFKMVSE